MTAAVCLLALTLSALPAAHATFLGHTAKGASTKEAKGARVLCIGDSLTAGVVGDEKGLHPYAKHLLALAKKHNVADFEVVEEGVSGELVVPTMVERTLQVLGAANAAGKDYTHIVIEGGFNDIGNGRTADDIFGGLLHMYRDAVQSGAHVVVVTLYEYGKAGHSSSSSSGGAGDNATAPSGSQEAHSRSLDKYEHERHGLNVLVREYASSYAQKGKLTLVDLDKHITRETKPPSGKGDSLYSDNLHMTAEGYQYIGQLIWDQVIAPDLGIKASDV